MRSLHARSAFLALALVVGVSAADAATRTYYDTSSKSWVTYDADKARRDSGLPQEPAASAPAPAESNAGSVTPAPAPQQVAMAPTRYPTPDKKFDRQVVAYDTTEEPGTVIVDTKEKFLYFVLEGGEAIRMGVGVGREGFGWTGTVHVGALQENPKWFPPAEMVARQPELVKYQTEGMPGGEGNPLGVRAIYLYDDKGKDTLYRIHGTIEPNSIGLNVSSGCIRMLNENVTELYGLVTVGTKVIVM